MDAAVLVGIATGAREWFETLLRRRDVLTEQERTAVQAFYTAVNETRIYVGSMSRVGQRLKLQDPEQRDYAEEANLSRLWTEASQQVAPFNGDLADRCFMKGDYWADPDAWTDSDIRKTRIELDRMFVSARRLAKKR